MKRVKHNKNKNLAIFIFAIPSAMFLLSFASVPLYNLFCKVTGYGGATNVAQKESDIITDKVISVISNELENSVFILWGSFAQSKKEIIDSNKHLILSAPHPSPLSAHRGFFGSKPFSKTNTFLKSKQIDMVEW